MDLDHLKTKRIGILGYAREGQSVARYLRRHGIAPVLFDKNTEIETDSLESYTGPGYLSHLSKVEVLFRSPGFWRQDPALLAFEHGGGVITSQTKFFFEQCPAKILGVTGTKGKGTTTTLCYEMAKAAGKSAYLTGNVGAVEPLEFLDDLGPDDWVCYELSSFQLQDLSQSPHIGVVLMTTADHLDVHQSIEEYHGAKAAITKFQKHTDFAIINKDFPASATIGELGNAQKLWISEQAKVSFGVRIEKNSLVAEGLEPEFQIPNGKLLELGELTLKGAHNLQNVGAALLAGAAMGLPLASMLETAKNFAGLEHRLEFVGERKGVEFYNDSFSTTPETATAAVRAFTQPIYLILGGSEKFLDYADLARVIATQANIAAVFLIGETATRMVQQLEDAGVRKEKIMQGATTLEQIFDRLHFMAEPGSAVLLSPATASFDMFPNYKERGKKFKELARNW